MEHFISLFLWLTELSGASFGAPDNKSGAFLFIEVFWGL